MNPNTPWEERLRLAISGTPRMYGIGITEETIVETVRSLLLAQREEMKKGLEGLKTKEVHSTTSGEAWGSKTAIFNTALDAAIAVVERV